MSYPALTVDEREILQLVANGDERAFRWLFNHYHQRLGGYIYNITKSHELAEEVVQDVFLKIWTNKTALADVANFKAYLHVVSKNHALNCLKKMAQDKALTKELAEVSYEIGAEDSGEESERYILVDEAIDHLPPQQRLVYLLSRHERLQYTEIAERLSLSRETVKKYLQISTESITCYIRKRLTISLLIFISNFI
ncbi:RNA polymerase sigma-70 factor, ECF subfamily [Dyadobacter koreensis]|uniref:RNA polymerase sigma factor n=1 Tax=Dyadobacter koreensis TaxID=408657 RepID=A0A1H6YST6_9BACT|nr:sigma-70 family RNA polymerase sigma factor [Dyadobacter koreensis]SEJ39805.1 RNA polymerase sigma-70 factor, ECF subfamily [Dyadobacter koreensis]